MATRTVHIPVNQWVDIAAAAEPPLVAGQLYSWQHFDRTIAFARLTYDGTAPDIAARGSKIFAANSPGVPPFFFAPPEAPGKLWVRAVEAPIDAEINPANPDGDGSTP